MDMASKLFTFIYIYIPSHLVTRYVGSELTGVPAGDT